MGCTSRPSHAGFSVLHSRRGLSALSAVDRLVDAQINREPKRYAKLKWADNQEAVTFLG